MILKKIWLTPPFAIARVGKSNVPLESFLWGENDLSPRGTGKTTIVPSETLSMTDNGEINSNLPSKILFKDEKGFRPVCPYFELRGEWENSNGKTFEGALTKDLLDLIGLESSDMKWSIQLANLKAYHYTQVESEKIYGDLNIQGNQVEKKQILGICKNAPNIEPLLIEGKSIPMGAVQLSKPNEEYPEYRLRFFAPEGDVYGPTDLNERDNQYNIDNERLIINPNSNWAQFRITNDGRTNPGGLFATYETNENGRVINKSLGLVDDVSDGIISCEIGNLKASCRLTVGPPDYSPDRRPFVSLADGLKDRIVRFDVIEDEYLADFEMTSDEIRDLFERILETLELMNLDFQNSRGIRENIGIANNIGLPTNIASEKLFPIMGSLPNRPLPLTEIGRQKHRRFVALEVIEDKLRENPELIDKWIRKPMTGDKFYDTKMPPLMRGSDRYPMHITQRQYNLLKSWVKSLRTNNTPGT